MKCIYCADRRQDPTLTLEHIWPQALGGAAAPSLFKTRDVCQACNSMAGQWVDAAFLKSWFITHEITNSARLFVDPRSPGPLPLSYMGLDKKQFPAQPGEIVEIWLGPGGESVHHVHEADSEKWFGISGGDFIKRQKADPGRAYLTVRTESPYWAATSLLSFIDYMRGARLLTVTQFGGLTPDIESKLTQESAATEVEAAEIAWLRQYGDGFQAVEVPLKLDFSRRFLAKLALGFGHTLFGAGYDATDYAEQLRQALWYLPGSGKPEPKIYGTDFLAQSSLSGVGLNGLRGTWSIIFHAGPAAFVMVLTTPSGRSMAMKISDQPTFWADTRFDGYRTGMFYFCIPERRAFLGPVNTIDFVGHLNGHVSDPTMAKIEAMKTDPALLPPLHPVLPVTPAQQSPEPSK